MALKVSITIDSPIDFKRIANGEHVIEQTDLDNIEIKFVEGDKGNSPLLALHELLDEFEKSVRPSRRRKGSVPKITAAHRSQTVGANQ